MIYIFGPSCVKKCVAFRLIGFPVVRWGAKHGLHGGKTWPVSVALSEMAESMNRFCFRKRRHRSVMGQPHGFPVL